MSKKIENIEETTEVMEVVEENTEIEVEETGKLSKVMSGIKKHGKKIAVGAAVAAASLIGFALVKNARSSSDYDSDYDTDEDIVDADSYEVND